MQMSLPANLDEAEQISHWQKKLEELKIGYERLLSHGNPLYDEQLAKLAEVTDLKRSTLAKWREDKLASIRNEKAKKISLLQSECERHKAEIPNLLERSIRQKFTQLQREFSHVFGFFTDRGIPFVDAFANDRSARVFTLSCEEPLLSPQEIKDDLERMASPRQRWDVVGGELVGPDHAFKVGEAAVLVFGSMRPIRAVVHSIEGSTVGFLPAHSHSPIYFSAEAIECGVVRVTTE
jgi:hypothetical protein